MFVGIDTSCYTTSLAVLDNQGRLLADARKPLPVAAGRRGLRQSEGVFLHLQHLPQLMEAVAARLGELSLSAVGVSSRPRPVEGSYMPVFTTGTSFARMLAAACGIPCFQLSHQEGHLLAGTWSAGFAADDFYALHVSGGTTELLSVQTRDTLQITLVGGTQDLHAGQFIDRTGVALGLPFPAGPHLEALAKTAVQAVQIPVSVKGSMLSFSGPESYVQRLLAGGKADGAAVARGVEHCIAESLRRIICHASKKQGKRPVLFVGGVMANRYIRSYLAEHLPGQCVFADTAYAGDNAVGAAYYAWQKVNEK
ncbi:MAG: O-sialoglycoprotein endopeptidase [Firmicutes bacterium]|nr:O-sialoglycoprotein endopeptidase [Bacillota bacterium]